MKRVLLLACGLVIATGAAFGQSPERDKKASPVSDTCREQLKAIWGLIPRDGKPAGLPAANGKWAGADPSPCDALPDDVKETLPAGERLWPAWVKKHRLPDPLDAADEAAMYHALRFMAARLQDSTLTIASPNRVVIDVNTKALADYVAALDDPKASFTGKVFAAGELYALVDLVAEQTRQAAKAGGARDERRAALTTEQKLDELERLLVANSGYHPRLGQVPETVAVKPAARKEVRLTEADGEQLKAIWSLIPKASEIDNPLKKGMGDFASSLPNYGEWAGKNRAPAEALPADVKKTLPTDEGQWPAWVKKNGLPTPIDPVDEGAMYHDLRLMQARQKDPSLSFTSADPRIIDINKKLLADFAAARNDPQTTAAGKLFAAGGMYKFVDMIGDQERRLADKSLDDKLRDDARANRPLSPDQKIAELQRLLLSSDKGPTQTAQAPKDPNGSGTPAPSKATTSPQTTPSTDPSSQGSKRITYKDTDTPPTYKNPLVGGSTPNNKLDGSNQQPSGYTTPQSSPSTQTTRTPSPQDRLLQSVSNPQGSGPAYNNPLVGGSTPTNKLDGSTSAPSGGTNPTGGSRYAWVAYDPNDPKDQKWLPSDVAKLKAKMATDPAYYQDKDGKIIYDPGLRNGTAGPSSSSPSGGSPASGGTRRIGIYQPYAGGINQRQDYDANGNRLPSPSNGSTTTRPSAPSGSSPQSNPTPSPGKAAPDKSGLYFDESVPRGGNSPTKRITYDDSAPRTGSNPQGSTPSNKLTSPSSSSPSSGGSPTNLAPAPAPPAPSSGTSPPLKGVRMPLDLDAKNIKRAKTPTDLKDKVIKDKD